MRAGPEQHLGSRHGGPGRRAATGQVRALGFSPDGRRLAVLVERENVVRLWQLDRLGACLDWLGLGEDAKGH